MKGFGIIGIPVLPVQETQSKVSCDENQQLLPYEAVDAALPLDDEAPYAVEDARGVLVDAGEAGLLQFLVLFRHSTNLWLSSSKIEVLHSTYTCGQISFLHCR